MAASSLPAQRLEKPESWTYVSFNATVSVLHHGKTH